MTWLTLIKLYFVWNNQMEKRSTPFWFVLISLGSIIGCGAEPGASMAAMKVSPVGGAMVRLPHDAGLVAIKTELADPSRAGENEVAATKIVAVFFENDGSTPMTLPPTKVVFELESFRSKTADTQDRDS